MTPSRVVRRRLDALYRRLPRVACKGLCAQACGPIAASGAEVARLEHVSGRRLEVLGADGLTCSILDLAEPLGERVMGRCSAYAVRPLICRLFGVSRELACPEGCVPERWIERAEGRRLLEEAATIGGEGVVSEGWET